MRLVLTILFGVLLAACGSPNSSAPVELGERSVTITANVPESTGPLYLTGNVEALGPWRADALEMAGNGAQRVADISLPVGQALEYKFTLGSWDREALGPSGMVMPNFVLEPAETEAEHDIFDFKKDVADYIATVEQAGIVGQLGYWLDVPSEYLSETRNVTVWTPPGYADNPTKLYRVIYMSDGQNLFDPRIANTGVDWGVDEAMAALMEQGVEPAIVVSSWSTSQRGPEYSPWHDAPNYARFIRYEIMPRVNAEYRTKTGPKNTFHVGSSMGGLLSFYMVNEHSDLFGACGCVSTHFPLSEEMVARYFKGIDGHADPDPAPYVLRDIAGGLKPIEGARYWFDYGTEGLDADYGPTHEAVRDWLLESALQEGTDFIVREYQGADHNEISWRARLTDVFEFLLIEDVG